MKPYCDLSTHFHEAYLLPAVFDRYNIVAETDLKDAARRKEARIQQRAEDRHDEVAA